MNNPSRRLAFNVPAARPWSIEVEGSRRADIYAHIVVNWVIAEHKSQGTMQLLMNRGEVECFWYFDVNGEAGKE